MDTDPAPEPGPTPYPTPFFIDFKNVKKKFNIFFLLLTQRYIILSLKNNFFFNFVLKFYLAKHYSSPLKTFMRKGKDPEPDPGGPKICVSCGSEYGSGSGSPTLIENY
jgi:hypothetical protein